MNNTALSLILLTTSVLYAQTTPSSPISHSNCSNIKISGKRFTSGTNGIAIKLVNCQNVTIENNELILNSGIIGIQIEGGKNIIIRHNYFQSFRSGVYAINTTGGIDIQCNSFKDIAGISPRGQIVQFNKGSGAGNRISWNILDHTFGSGNPEDLINMYGTSGTTADPIQIIGNKLRGGGPSKSGGGIMVGDNGGQNIRVEDNILVDPGQYGIGSPAGKNITIKGNTVYGKKQDFTNVGIYVGLKSEIDAGFACDGPTIRVENNRVNWLNKSGVQNDYYFYSGCPNVVKSNNTSKAPIGPEILADELSLDATHCADSTNPVAIMEPRTTRNGARGTSTGSYQVYDLLGRPQVLIPNRE